MVKHRNKVLAAAGAIVAAAAFTATGLTAASASPDVGSHSSRTEHLQIMTTSATAATASVVGYGAFTAGGVDHPGNSADTLDFAHGSFQVRHSAGHGTRNFDPRSCLFTLNFAGTIALGHGTGWYAGISGHGTYKITIVAVSARSHGRCDQAKPPVVYQQLIQAQSLVHE